MCVCVCVREREREREKSVKVVWLGGGSSIFSTEVDFGASWFMLFLEHHSLYT